MECKTVVGYFFFSKNDGRGGMVGGGGHALVLYLRFVSQG